MFVGKAVTIGSAPGIAGCFVRKEALQTETLLGRLLSESQQTIFSLGLSTTYQKAPGPRLVC